MKARRMRQIVLLVLCLAAPTAGDIGGCGESVVELDAEKFFDEKKFIDCGMCLRCGFVSAACTRACEEPLDDPAFPEGCFPLVHDGEVCLNALEDADCDLYATFVRDEAPSIPQECNFCPLDRRDEVTP